MVAKLIKIFTIYGVTVMFLFMGHPTEAKTLKTVYQPDEPPTWYERKMLQLPVTGALATKIHRFQDKDLTTRIQPAESLTLPESIRSTERKTKLEKTFHKCLIKCELNAYSCKHATSYKHNKKPFNRGFCKKQKYLCLELCQ